MPNKSQTIIRYILGALLAFAALNAFAGGYYAMAGADDVPTDWLKGTPFQSYFVPGLILFFVVGGILLIAAVAVFEKLRFAKFAALGSIVVVGVWLLVQMTIIGYVSWMQPATAGLSVIILLLAWLLPGTTRFWLRQ